MGETKPVNAIVVGDKRKSFGRRLGFLALALLLLFFAINGYISSSHNGHLLDQANRDRDKLTNSVDRLTKTQSSQTHLIKQLQDALRKQNRILEKSGLAVVIVPGDNTFTPSPSPTPTPKPSPTHGRRHHRNKHHGSGPRPSPSPNPVQNLRDQVCSLTGICTIHLF